MSIEIIADKGAANANSYAAVEEFDAYWDGEYGAEDCKAIPLVEKQRLLITATRQIDRLTPAFPPASPDQSLMFPMRGAMPDGFQDAKRACILQALYVFRHHGALQDATVNAMQGVKAESTSGYSRGFTGFNWLKRWDLDAVRLLTRYIHIMPGLCRG